MSMHAVQDYIEPVIGSHRSRPNDQSHVGPKTLGYQSSSPVSDFLVDTLKQTAVFILLLILTIALDWIVKRAAIAIPSSSLFLGITADIGTKIVTGLNLTLFIINLVRNTAKLISAV
jgi:hypothetical protein